MLRETPKIRKIYSDIQNQLFYMIPESFHRVYLYAAVMEQVHGMPIGEMFFYYFPGGILKKKPVNVYEIPSKFNIDEEAYSKLINQLYDTIKKLRQEIKDSGQKTWTNITISIEDYQFSIEYHYDDLNQSPYSSYERHIIWRYRYLQTDIQSYNRKERELIHRFLLSDDQDKGETYRTVIYQEKPKNIVGYHVDDYVQIPKEEVEQEEKEEQKVKIEKQEEKLKQEKQKGEDKEEEETNQILNIYPK